MEGVVRLGDLHQRAAVSQRLDHRADPAELRELVLRALDEEHWHQHAPQMRGPFDRGHAGRVQRKTEEDQAGNAGQRRQRLSLRAHAAAEGLAAREEAKRSEQLGRSRDSRANRGMGDARRIGALAAELHVRELVAQGRDPPRGKTVRRGAHEGMLHAGARAVRQHVAGERIGGRLHERRHADAAVDGNGDLLRSRRHGGGPRS